MIMDQNFENDKNLKNLSIIFGNQYQFTFIIYCSCEKGSIENINKLIPRKFWKQTDFANIS